jgi:NAD(P)-dependent dehydrogenase (short-subunit alcohol dehydrogenase family)
MAALYEDVKGKIVLVTGGTSGLGYAIAGAFVAHGATVVIIGRDPDRLARARKELGGNLTALSCDLRDIDRFPALIGEIRESLGEIDVLVNNAGVNLKKEAVAVTDREYGDIIQTNQTAVFALAREVAKPMLDRGNGSIIMISSMAAHYGIPGVIAYTAAKSAVEGMTRALAVEWSPRGVRVNCIAPGFIATPMSAKALDADAARRNRVLARTPMGRLGEPSDVANAALFLASSQAKFITGVVLPVDGGNSIGF